MEERNHFSGSPWHCFQLRSQNRSCSGPIQAAWNTAKTRPPSCILRVLLLPPLAVDEPDHSGPNLAINASMQQKSRRESGELLSISVSTCTHSSSAEFPLPSCLVASATSSPRQ